MKPIARSFPRRLTAALPALLALLLAPREVGACSVCLAGDPVFSTHGASAQEAGSFSLYIEAKSFRKTSGAHAHEDADHGTEAEQGNHEHGEEGAHGDDEQHAETMHDEGVEESGDERTRSTLSGLGDVSLGSSFVLWRNREVLPSTWLEGRLWLKAPTGRDETQVDGVRNPHLQPGTGSWDFGAGLAAVSRTGSPVRPTSSIGPEAAARSAQAATASGRRNAHMSVG